MRKFTKAAGDDNASALSITAIPPHPMARRKFIDSIGFSKRYGVREDPPSQVSQSGVLRQFGWNHLHWPCGIVLTSPLQRLLRETRATRNSFTWPGLEIGDAYSELVWRYQRPIWGLASILLGDRFEAEDIAQEAFLRA